MVGEEADGSLADRIETKMARRISGGLAERLSFSLHVHIGAGNRFAVRPQHLPGEFAVGRLEHRGREIEMGSLGLSGLGLNGDRPITFGRDGRAVTSLLWQVRKLDDPLVIGAVRHLANTGRIVS